MAKTYTTEQLADRWEDILAIRNLVGRRSWLTLLVKDQGVFDEMWSKNEPCLGFNSGYYKGYEAVSGYFSALRELGVKRAALAKKAYPDELGGKSAVELIGVGALHFNNVTTPLIELAGDRQTAKGLFYLMDSSIDYQASGREANMSWGRLGVDFIKEDGRWKIRHMVYAEDISAGMGTNWAVKQPEKAKDPIFGQLADFTFPEPTDPNPNYELWSEKRPIYVFPAMPEPYETFAETFSYGV